eukprot:1817247-Rhodomonas_salina.1
MQITLASSTNCAANGTNCAANGFDFAAYHTRTHVRTHARTHARARAHTHTGSRDLLPRESLCESLRTWATIAYLSTARDLGP